MKLTKQQRTDLKMKFGGHCAYCGCELGDRWHADQIVLLHPKLQSEDLMPTGVTEVLVTKNRHGKKGIVLVQDQLDVCRFASVAQEQVGGGV